MGNSILYEKPVFELKLHSHGTRYRVLVNGVLSHRDNGKGQVTLKMPINHWMRSGKNTLELIVYPDKKGISINDHSVIKAELYVRNMNEKQDYRIGGFEFNGKSHIAEVAYEGYQLDPITFERDDEGIIEVSAITETKDTYFDGVHEFSQTFDIPNNLPLWKFFESDDVPKIQYEDKSRRDEFWDLSNKMVQDLLSPIHDAIVAGKVDSIMPLFAERNRETDQAFYKEPGTTERELRYAFTEDIKQVDLHPLIKNEIGYTSERNQKLAGLYSGNRVGGISGAYKNWTGTLSFPIVFRKKNEKWIITR